MDSAYFSGRSGGQKIFPVIYFPKFAVNNDYVVSIMGSIETTTPIPHDQAIWCIQQVYL